MPSAQRRDDTGVIQRLLKQPQRFGFFQAMRLLELYFSRQQPTTLSAANTFPVRLRNSLSLSFPASEIQSIAAYDENGEAVTGADNLKRMLETGKLHSIELTPGFFGLLGSAGALPMHYSEQLADYDQARRSQAARAFLDLFSNRTTCLFYQAWKKYRLPLQYELTGRDAALDQLLSIGGVSAPALREDMRGTAGPIYEETLAQYCGVLWQRSRSAATIEQIIGDHFQVPVCLQQFVARWYALPDKQRSHLSQANARLGGGAILGERVLQCDLRMKLFIGPLDADRFDSFLPHGESAIALKKLLQRLTGARLEYEIRLLLAPADVKTTRLDYRHTAGRLGQDAFLCSRPATAARADAGFDLVPA